MILVLGRTVNPRCGDIRHLCSVALKFAHQLLAQVFPLLLYVPIARVELFNDMNQTLEGVSRKFLERSKGEKEAGVVDGKDDKSIIGVLIKAKDAGADVQLTIEEILAQMKLFITAGCETTSGNCICARAGIFCYIVTSLTMTWALLELGIPTYILSYAQSCWLLARTRRTINLPIALFTSMLWYTRRFVSIHLWRSSFIRQNKMLFLSQSPLILDPVELSIAYT